MIKITFDSAVAALHKAVASKPEGYIYTNPRGDQAGATSYGGPTVSCDYFTEEGEPSCAVGFVLSEHGVSSDVIRDRGLSGHFAQNLLSSLRHDIQLEIDDRTITLLSHVQSEQDRGVPWGEAVSETVGGFKNNL